MFWRRKSGLEAFISKYGEWEKKINWSCSTHTRLGSLSRCSASIQGKLGLYVSGFHFIEPSCIPEFMAWLDGLMGGPDAQR